MLQTISAIITILNFVYALLAAPGLGPVERPDSISLSPTLAFFLFFVLEFVCSYFICWSIIRLTESKPNHVRSYSLLLGIINAGTTLFNYQFLFNVRSFEASFDATVFCGFVLAAYAIDWIVISDMRRANPRYIWRAPLDFRIDDRNEFLRMQFLAYLLSALYLLVVAKSF